MPLVESQTGYQAGSNERRLPAPGATQHEQHAAALMAADAAQALQAFTDLSVAPEEDTGVLRLERHEARIRRTPGRGVPTEQICRVEPGGLERSSKALPSCIHTLCQIDDLDRLQDVENLALFHLDREDRFAERARQCDLREAPARGHRRGAAQYDDRATGRQLAIELSLPVSPGRNARVRIEIEEDRLVLVLLGKPLLQLRHNLGVGTRMADEDGAQECPRRTRRSAASRYRPGRRSPPQRPAGSDRRRSRNRGTSETRRRPRGRPSRSRRPDRRPRAA